MRAARSVESLDSPGRSGPPPPVNMGRSYDDQQLHDALSEQRVGPGPPTNRRQAPGQYIGRRICVCVASFVSHARREL